VFGVLGSDVTISSGRIVDTEDLTEAKRKSRKCREEERLAAVRTEHVN